MSLDTYTTEALLEVLEYFGWPEGLVFIPKECDREHFLLHGMLQEEVTLAVLQCWMLKIIGDRWEYELNVNDSRLLLLLREKGTMNFPAVFSDTDLNTLLLVTCTWIMEKENG